MDTSDTRKHPEPSVSVIDNLFFIFLFFKYPLPSSISNNCCDLIGLIYCYTASKFF